MSILDRFQAYEEAFEKAYDNDDWSIVRPFFADDAVYVAPASEPAKGADAIMAHFKGSLDAMDRKFPIKREIEVTAIVRLVDNIPDEELARLIEYMGTHADKLL